MAEWKIDITKAVEAIAQKLVSDGYTVSRWIKCSESLPEADEMVIVACYGSDLIIPNEGESIGECVARLQRKCIRVTLGYIDEEGFWNGADYFPMMIAPTFWQPLPKPPIPQSPKDGDAE